MLKPFQVKTRRYCSRTCWDDARRNPDKPSPPKRPLETRRCDWCGEDYAATARHQRYCSQACATKNMQDKCRRTDIVERPCENCGVQFRPRPDTAGRFCSRPCLYAGTRGTKAPHWKGGRHTDPHGYVLVYAPDHPGAHGHGGYVFEHRYVMAKKLGRPLQRSETVHHINGIRSDNRPENLQLRQGRHGNGVRHVCGDCGSTNIISTQLG